jgi:hypothetical protein
MLACGRGVLFCPDRNLFVHITQVLVLIGTINCMYLYNYFCECQAGFSGIFAGSSMFLSETKGN